MRAAYTELMNVSIIGMDSTRSGLLDQVGTTMLAKNLKGEQERAAELLKGLGPSAPLQEGSGQLVDLLA
jgi:hypothetical protein